MSKFIVCLFALCFVLCLTKADEPEKCEKPNQEWTNCGTACPRRCGDTKTRPCTKQCVFGCRCKSGTVLKSDGSCVEPKDC